MQGAMGIAGEMGEIVDPIKKWIFQGRELDREHLAEELGDIMWYIGLLCNTLDLNLYDITWDNKEKLKARYPEGFTKGGGIR